MLHLAGNPDTRIDDVMVTGGSKIKVFFLRKKCYGETFWEADALTIASRCFLKDIKLEFALGAGCSP